MPKLIVFPGDPLMRYFHKGEVKERYWNPENIFDEVHAISLCDEDIEPDKVQSFAGDARFFIHPVGRPNPSNFLAVRKRALHYARSVQPDLIKGHGALAMGYYAAYCGRELRVPSVVALHSDYSIIRTLRAAGISGLPRSLYQTAYRLTGMEHFALRTATAVTCAYEFPARHARWAGSPRIEVIYNRVDTNRFKPTDKKPSEPLKVLTVGNHIPGKEPSAIIGAVADLPVELTVIGKGPLTPKLRELSRRQGTEHRVHFVDAVANADIHDEYQRHDIFCISIRYPGVCIPVLEAMASGLPVLTNKPLWEKAPEVVGEQAVIVDNNKEGFARGLQKFIAAPDLLAELGRQNRLTMERVDGRLMEQREAALFRSLIA
jgi:glycosyltransferase involved in cell wall biosynthesis